MPSDKKYGEILFRKDKSEPYAKLDADFLSKGGNEVADLYEFFADDINLIAGEIAAGSKEVCKFINKIPGVKLLKPILLWNQHYRVLTLLTVDINFYLY